jgi:hypothetical protein
MMLVTQLAFGQLCFPVKKVYAFYQPVTAGIMSKEEAANRRQRGNYLVYITSKAEALKLNNVWINGTLYHADLQQVTSPVSIPSGNGNVLVPATTRNTYQLKFTALTTQAMQSQIPKKYSAFPLVLEIQYKNRKKFIAVDSIRQIEVMPLQ